MTRGSIEFPLNFIGRISGLEESLPQKFSLVTAIPQNNGAGYCHLFFNKIHIKYLQTLLSLPAERSQHEQCFLSSLMTYKNKKHKIINLYFSTYFVLYAKYKELNLTYFSLFFSIKGSSYAQKFLAKRIIFYIITFILLVTSLKLHFI